MVKILLLLFLFAPIAFADSEDSITKVCVEMKLVPASKAIVQWERVFSSDKRKSRYGIDQLSDNFLHCSFALMVCTKSTLRARSKKNHFFPANLQAIFGHFSLSKSSKSRS